MFGDWNGNTFGKWWGYLAGAVQAVSDWLITRARRRRRR